MTCAGGWTLDFWSQNAAEVAITGLVLDVEAGAFSGELDFCADDGFDAGFGCCLGKFDCAMEVVFISERDGGEVVKFSEFDDGIDGEGGIEERVVAVEVERNIRWPVTSLNRGRG